MYTLTSNVHEFETKHHVHFIKSSVSVPYTNKCTLCMYTHIIMQPLYSHPAGLSNKIKLLSSGERRGYEVLNPGGLNTLLPSKVINV